MGTGEISNCFNLLVTNVDAVGPFLRISGQTNKSSSALLEQLLASADPELRAGKGALPPNALVAPGLICLAQYKDGAFYRARVLEARDGLVTVQFIDYGNRDTIAASDVRAIDQFPPQLSKLPALASEYILARGVHPLGRWDDPTLSSLQRCLCSREYPCMVESKTARWITISIPYNAGKLVDYLISCKICVPIPEAQQVDLLNQLAECVPFMAPPRLQAAPEAYAEHVVPFPNRGFPSNPAATMRMQSSLNGGYMITDPSQIPPSAISQRLQAHRSAPRNVVHLKPLQRPQYSNGASETAPASPAAAPSSSPGGSPKKTTTYKTRLLEVNSEHKVCVSFARDGPELFAVQLSSEAFRLKEMMSEINKLPHRSLTEPPMIGTVCLGRMSGDRTICRAIVMNICGSQCKLFFVDFGDTEMVSYYDIFDIPEQFIKPGVYALRFCLSGLSELTKGPALNEVFQQLVELKKVILRVVTPEGPPLIQYGELYIGGKSVLELLKEATGDGLELKALAPLPEGSTQSVLVSYVDSCHKFFIQLSENIDTLNEVMAVVETHCKSAAPLASATVGSPCCALFPEDGVWYRAQVVEVRGDRALVCYVDYGNEQEVGLTDLRHITAKLLELPAQALKCALKGFEDRPVEQTTSNQLEMLALERTLSAKVVSHLDSGAMLVSLIHDSVTPPIDIAKRMLQLSRPPNAPREKQTRPPPASPPPVSSPESDRERNRFRSDKLFREDRRRDDEWAPRGGSFRQKERTGGKPWEKNQERTDDEWNDTSAASKPFRDSDNSKKEDTWADSHDRRDKDWAGERKERGGGDRHPKRDNWEKKDNWEEKKENFPKKNFGDRGERNFDRGDRNFDRGDRNFDRGDRNSDRGDKTSDRGDRNSDRGNRKFDRGDRNFDRGERSNERGERNFDRGERKERSNFVPRERTERPFDANRSFGSNKSSGKELSNPVPLETQFANPDIEIGSQLEVSIAWFTSPDNFFAQITSQQPTFTDMMNRIPQMYKGIKPYNGTIEVGSSVLARFPEDRVLYRATVMGVQPFGKYIVQYVDFGNKTLVESRDIWQLDQELMSLPKMAVQCSLMGVKPLEKEWTKSKEMDLCFNTPRYQCVFSERVDGMYRVSLWNNGVSVAEILAEKGLAGLDEQASVILKDEPIDLCLVVGQELLCHVTQADSPCRIHVRLDLDKAALVENMVAGLDRANLEALPAETVAAGTHCLLTHEDRLYRALLEDASDLEAVRAQLPDYGYSVAVPAANLYVLPAELSTYYYQSLVCRLNNYEDGSTRLMTDEELSARLKDNKFIMYINDVDGNVLVVTLYDLMGNKVGVFEPDEGAFPTVVPLCARPVFNQSFGTAFLVHASSLSQVYLQKASDEPKVAELLDRLFKFYEEGRPEAMESYEEQSLCAAKSSDGNWYRATLTAISDETCNVQFVDYGNSEDVAKESIKTLDSTFYEPHCLALVVSLGLEPLQDDAVSKLTEMLTDKEVLVTLSIGDEGWLANLNLDGEDLSLKLVNEKIATPQVVAVDTTEVVTDAVSGPTGTVQVYIAHVDTPGQFWLQMSDKVDQIEEIQAELQEKSTTYPDLEVKELGTLCVAKYSVDEMWYRAEVLDSDADITTVRFIDYGNTDVLDNVPEVLKVIPDHLKEIEKFAIKSSVNAVPTGTGQWSEPASDYFTELVGDMSSPLDALIVLKDVTTYVDLFVNGENLTDKLVAAQHATRSEETECGDLASCFASHVNSPSEFWIQLENCTPELQAMEAAMADCESFPELTSKEEGTICAAKYPEDGCWYRAQIIVEGSEGIEVLFMDYGNASIATELRCLPDELKVKPALSRKCALQKPRDIKAWSRKSELKFNDMAAEGATIFSVQFIASGDISIVELYLDGKSVTEELATLCDAPPTTDRLDPLGQEMLSDGTVSHINSLKDFYFKIEDSNEKMVEKLSVAETFEEATEVRVGSLVAAQWNEDELWYRAKVIELCDVGAHVQFIDFGNKAKCDKFKQLPEDIVSVEPLSIHCVLAGYQNSENDDTEVLAFQKLLEMPHHRMQIEFLDTTKEPKLVKLLINGEDVCSLISNKKSESAAFNVNSESIPQTDEVSINPSAVLPEVSLDVTQTQMQSDETTEHEISVLDESVDANVTVIENTSENKKTILDDSGPIESEEFTTPHSTPNDNSANSSPKKKLNDSITSSSGKSDNDDKLDNIINAEEDTASNNNSVNGSPKKQNPNDSFNSASSKSDMNDRSENVIDPEVNNSPSKTNLNDSFTSTSGKSDTNNKSDNVEAEADTAQNENSVNNSPSKTQLNDSLTSTGGKSDTSDKVEANRDQAMLKDAESLDHLTEVADLETTEQKLEEGPAMIITASEPEIQDEETKKLNVCEKDNMVKEIGNDVDKEHQPAEESEAKSEENK